MSVAVSDTESNAETGKWLNAHVWLPPAVLAVGLLLVDDYNHTLFHTLSELFGVGVAILTAVVGWYSYPLARNHFFIWLALGYFWVGALDLIHVLSYHGMGLFHRDMGPESISFWVGTRYFEASLLLVAPFFLKRDFNRLRVFLAMGIVSALFTVSVFANIYPTTFVPGQGLTPFKIISEYLIVGLLVIAGVRLWRLWGQLDHRLVALLIASVVFTIASELSLTSYRHIGDVPTFWGHVFKLISYWFIFLSVVRTGLSEPFRLLAEDTSSFDAVPYPTVVLDAQGRVCHANRAAQKGTGLTHPQFVGHHCHHLLHPRHQDPNECPVCRAIIDGEALDAPLELYYPETDRWCQITLAPVPGQGTGFVHVSHDVTDRRRAEHSLRSSEANYRSLFHNSSDALFVQRLLPDGSMSNFLAVNEVACRRLGYSREELLRVDPNHINDSRATIVIEQFGARGEALFETVHVTKNGVRIPVEVNARQITYCNELAVLSIARDITSRKQAELALRESEQRFRNFVEAASDWLWEVDASGTYTYVSPRVRDVLGYEPDEVLGKAPDELMTPEDAPRIRSILARLAAKRAPIVSLENTNLHRNGTEVVLETSGVPFFDDKGEFAGYRGIDRDITRRRQAEQDLRENQRQLAEGEQIAHMGSWRWDAKRGQVTLSSGLYELLGISRERFDATPDGLRELISTEDRSALLQAIRSKIRDARPVRFEHRVDTPEGQRWVLTQARPRMNEAGEVTSITGTMLDITERKCAQQALEASERRYRALMENASDAIVVADGDGRFIDVNRRAVQLFGYTKAELLRLGVKDIHPPAEGAKVRKSFRDMKTGGHSLCEHILVRKDGSTGHVEVAGTRIQYGDDEVYLGTFRDISERKRIEVELAAHRENLESLVAERTRELRALNKEMESFSYSVSHDLRAPLRAINGFGHALREDFSGQLDEEALWYLDRIFSATNRMSELIDGLLNLSQVIRADLDVTDVDISELALEIARIIQDAEPRRGARIEVEPGLRVRGDRTLLQLLLQNLLHNAWKFTDEQNADALVRFGRTERDGDLVFFVADNGIGFDMAYAEKLFRPFERLHDAGRYEGTGIGLATVRRIIDRHGGHVWAEGMPGYGAAVYFILSETGEQ